MDQQQSERLIEALESIAESLNCINSEGISAFLPGLLTVNAMISSPEGLKISEMPDEHFVQVFNPVSHLTGQAKRFEIESN